MSYKKIMNVLYSGLDSLKVIESLPDEKYDFIFLDPPYFTGTGFMLDSGFKSIRHKLSKETGIPFKDVPLEVTVELGRTAKPISDILDFAPGTIIELDKVAGEPVDVLVNGKFVAKGEVVVIEESFGVRVTEIVQ